MVLRPEDGLNDEKYVVLEQMKPSKRMWVYLNEEILGMWGSFKKSFFGDLEKRRYIK